ILFIPSSLKNMVAASRTQTATEQTLLALGGSAYHIIGQIGDATIGEPSSDLSSLLKILNEELQFHSRSPDREDFYDKDAALNAIEVMMRRMKGITQPLEFLVKRIARANQVQASFLLPDAS
ncbi:MAG: hypothetical protein J2P36_39875, partial [Ktedonobacteraceae bacterium]|nr:hypothetical protein [Ktedonobacteraceae bacterium]